MRCREMGRMATMRITYVGNGLFVPYSSVDAATARSFGADDVVDMTSGATLAQWQAFRSYSGLRILQETK